MYARWEADAYTISYTLYNETNAAGNPSTYTIESAAVTLAAAARPHYTFAGWYDNPDFSGNPISAIPAGGTGDKIF
jgi:uncharacterized repeat protein (TIGR02543 family)